MKYVDALKVESNKTRTENGAASNRSTLNECLNLFAAAGALRSAQPNRIENMLIRAYCENPDTALRILFYTRDIRGGLGERGTFRIMLHCLAGSFPASVIKNIPFIPEYGRFDDLLVLFDTPCEAAMLAYIGAQLRQDIEKMRANQPVSLLAKWLPSVNASNEAHKNEAKRLAKALKMSEKEYRQTLSALKRAIGILETKLCEKDYTFDYEKLPSKALFQYHDAFFRNDAVRYMAYLAAVSRGKAKMNCETLFPYEILKAAILGDGNDERRSAADTTWEMLPNYCDGRNALAVIDGSLSMYHGCSHSTAPILIAVSLGLYFAEHNTGYFKNQFITFSETPQLIRIEGESLAQKARYCMSYNEAANTDLYAVFTLILAAAVKHHLPQSELPETLYIISDMEFDVGVNEDKTVFEDAKEVYESYGYHLPTLVYWNVNAGTEQYPVTKDDTGTVLLSGASPRLFELALSKDIDPLKMMLDVLNCERYRRICA